MGAASGKLDALLFMAGLVLGIWGFAEVYTTLYDFAWSGGIGVVTLPGLFGLPAWVVAVAVVVLALALFRLAGMLEQKFG